MSYHDNQYLTLMRHVLDKGTWKQNRTGIKTKSIFGYQMRFDLSDETIPLLTTKQMHTRSIIHELLWYMMGTGNIKYLQDNNVTIWDEWADENGDLGPVYGYQWRHWKTYEKCEAFGWDDSDDFGVYDIVESTPVDQIAELIYKLKHTPDDRRMIVSAWNVADLKEMRLPPCHYTFQCYVAKGELSMIINQRSCDLFLGVPFNIVQYSLLLRMLAEVCNLFPGELIWNGGDVHIYENHLLQCNLQLDNEPYESPKFYFNRSVTDIDGFKFEDFVIENYKYHPSIKADVAV